MDHKLRLAIVSEDEVIVRGLVSVVADLAETVEVQEAPGPGPADAPVDVVLYDVMKLHHGAGEDLVRWVKETDAAVVAAARELRPDLADQALAMGVDGVIALSASTEEIRQVIQVAAFGDLMGDGTSASVDYTLNPDRDDDRAVLSARETDVLALVATGISNEEIARRLFLSINTVKTYVRTAYRKIGVSSRSQAVGWALQNGFHP
ncbi:response regulator transcription factor [Nocardioides sp.]|uniref:helix-turn-helix transcriptional regulator n=1 Tax=Nocardioides sp. TaxID=35761 RepID=UPI00286D1287|nr:response regulator transcription factor [Nocardioides sp.]